MTHLVTNKRKIQRGIADNSWRSRNIKRHLTRSSFQSSPGGKPQMVMRRVIRKWEVGERLPVHYQKTLFSPHSVNNTKLFSNVVVDKICKLKRKGSNKMKELIYLDTVTKWEYSNQIQEAPCLGWRKSIFVWPAQWKHLCCKMWIPLNRRGDLLTSSLCPSSQGGSISSCSGSISSEKCSLKVFQVPAQPLFHFTSGVKHAQQSLGDGFPQLSTLKSTW